MRREPDFFGDDELVLIYIAKRLREALKLESLLTEASVEYLVEPDRYHGGIIFRTERIGAFFYVNRQAAEGARQVLRNKGYRPLEQAEGAEPA
jgi:hypothetical protein